MKGIMKVNKKYFLLFFIFIYLSFLFGCNGVTPTCYTITATMGTGGSIDPSGAVAVTEGSNQIFSIIPDKCYQVYEILVDGISVETANTYTFTNIHQNYTIHVAFVPRKIYNEDTGLDYEYIQDSIDSALNEETIIICPGTYKENIKLNNRDITIRSADPSDPAIVAVTIIDGGEKGSVVEFTGGDTSTLEGLTIQNGKTEGGGGIFIQNSSPIISGNIITDNRAGWGGGIDVDVYSAPTISGNIITGNSAITGGGILVNVNSSPTITNNDIMGNVVSYDGGGIYIDNNANYLIIGGTGPSDLANFNTICGNSPDQIDPNNYPHNYITTFCMIELNF